MKQPSTVRALNGIKWGSILVSVMVLVILWWEFSLDSVSYQLVTKLHFNKISTTEYNSAVAKFNNSISIFGIPIYLFNTLFYFYLLNLMFNILKNEKTEEKFFMIKFFIPFYNIYWIYKSLEILYTKSDEFIHKWAIMLWVIILVSIRPIHFCLMHFMEPGNKLNHFSLVLGAIVVCNVLDYFCGLALIFFISKLYLRIKFLKNHESGNTLMEPSQAH